MWERTYRRAPYFEDLEAIRLSAAVGQQVLEKALKEGETSLVERSASLRGSLAARSDHERRLREQEGSRGSTLGYHQQMGMEKGSDAAVKAANKAWGRMQMMNHLGVFRRKSQESSDAGDTAADG